MKKIKSVVSFLMVAVTITGIISCSNFNSPAMKSPAYIKAEKHYNNCTDELEDLKTSIRCGTITDKKRISFLLDSLNIELYRAKALRDIALKYN